jgi:DNA helicase-2/ATP-dependent DNA helicase PcrA
MNSRIEQPDTHADVVLKEKLNVDTPANFIMVAGAGSGKTTSLVKALAYLEAQKGEVLRSRGKKIACITYTEIAVSEILKDVAHSPLFHVSTIHSFLWTVIRPFQADIGRLVRQKIETKISEAKEKINKPKTHQSTRDSLNAEIISLSNMVASLAEIKTYSYGTGSNYAEGILGHSDILNFGITLIEEKELLQKVIARRFPFVFIDESQDTNSNVYNALKKITEVDNTFCLGFFGDPMQKIYLDGIGRINRESGWEFITKSENFRCPNAVLNVINTIRSEDDGLVQTRSREIESNGERIPLTGSARLFIFPMDQNRDQNIAKVRSWIADAEKDNLWLPDDPLSDVRILVIVHKMAANRLGFPELFSVFNDLAPQRLKDGFIEGTSWPLVPFLRYVIPLLNALREGNEFGMMKILREHCPLLQKDSLATQNVSQTLRIIKTTVEELNAMFLPESQSTISEVLRLIHTSGLVGFEDKYIELIDEHLNVGITEQEEWVSDFKNCKAVELCAYQNYIENLSPFSTQQGIKGAEFDRVLVILDDEEGKGHRLFSYGKYFGFIEPSQTDLDNISEGKDTSMSRTRRLFYVCCSRAKKDLAVVLFAPNVAVAKEAVLAKNIFPAVDIHLL